MVWEIFETCRYVVARRASWCTVRTLPNVTGPCEGGSIGQHWFDIVLTCFSLIWGRLPGQSMSKFKFEFAEAHQPSPEPQLGFL
jgi:hypothetical protein